MVRLETLTATSVKMAVLWDVAPCSLTDVSEELTNTTQLYISQLPELYFSVSPG
jgi:hypothetical protein